MRNELYEENIIYANDDISTYISETSQDHDSVYYEEEIERFGLIAGMKIC